MLEITTVLVLLLFSLFDGISDWLDERYYLRQRDAFEYKTQNEAFEAKQRAALYPHSIRAELEAIKENLPVKGVPNMDDNSALPIYRARRG